jgi:hypothetical protein
MSSWGDDSKEADHASADRTRTAERLKTIQATSGWSVVGDDPRLVANYRATSTT